MTTDPQGRADEQVTWTQDRTVVARLDDLAAEGYYDPDVDVQLEDFAWSTDDGGSVSGSQLVLIRKRPQEPGEMEALIEASTGVPFEEWERLRSERIAALPSREEVAERDIAAAEEAGEEVSELVVRLAAEPTTVIPRRLTALLPRSELERFDRDLERAEAIVERGDEIVELQRELVTWAEAEGAEVLGRSWARNTVAFSAPATLLRELIQRSDVLSARRSPRIVPEVNFPLDDVRAGIQVQPFIAAGYDGDRTSSRNAHGIWLGILESTNPGGPGLVDNHDGFKTNAVTSRVFDTWECPDPPIECGHALEPCESLHGMKVSSIAAGDFLDGQKPGWSQTDRENRTGIAQEASLFLGTHTGNWNSFNNLVGKAMLDNIDVVNSSAGNEDGACEPASDFADVVNAAYDDGIIWVNSLGNNGACEAPTCNANDLSAAYGSIAVAGHDAYDDGTFDDQWLCENSGTADGRATWGLVPDLTAPAGVFQPMNCINDIDMAAQGFCAGSSFAAPHVAGAVTLLKDFWIAAFGDASAQSPGRMHSVMLMMGDGCSEVGLDGLWGAGRLRMRKFDSAGLDAPYKVRVFSSTLSSGDSIRTWDVNPDANNVNQPLAATVDALVVTAWCKVADPEAAALDVTLNFYDVDRLAFPPGTTRTYPGEKSRISMSPEAHRYRISLVVSGIDYTEQIPCWVTMLYEDNARNDADGPPATIEPFYVDDPYGQGVSAQPANCTPAGWCVQ